MTQPGSSGYPNYQFNFPQTDPSFYPANPYPNLTTDSNQVYPPDPLFDFSVPPQDSFHHIPLSIKLPPMVGQPLRRSGRHHTASDSVGPSGSEYHESERSIELDDAPHEPEIKEDSPPITMTTTRGRRVVKKNYIESEDDDRPAEGLFDDDKLESHNNKRNTRRHTEEEAGHDDSGIRTLRSRNKSQTEQYDDDDDDRTRLRPRRSGNRLAGFIVTDDEDQPSGHRYEMRNRKRPGSSRPNGTSSSAPRPKRKPAISSRTTRITRRNANRETIEDDYVQQTSSGASADADGSFDEAAHLSSDLDLEPEPEPTQDVGDEEDEQEGDGKPYSLRARAKKINYAIPPPLEDMPAPPRSNGGRVGGGKGKNGPSRGFGGGHGRPKKGLGWSASGAELGRWMGMGGDDSDSDHATRTPRKPFGMGAFGAGVPGGAGMGGLISGDLAAGGTPSNLGKVGDAVLADADPLGVNVNVTFDEVGGLDDHIHSLKEMTLLPLLYPEVFQRFKVTPPRGVLFHGPPGTGKTLLARALAASSRSGGKQISFFMRKGADCLSKWVGEAERQLRLLFEEARASQPSIIFFDEIDGLAPVRSSKQDQIHASIVSTLLALMDGMDGRGQVVVIGATNRPDAVDPALRRPGRFDREFYFGLPGLEAREKILGIMTKGWDGWGDEAGEEGKERLRGLAKLTKGYGGADLRALCTEATLNAIQRRYPQIYKSEERLLLKPETIGVGLRDFMISIKKLVPSSARSSSSAATPLPPQFVPLLNGTLETVKEVISRVLPVEKKLTALEEAEFEDDGGEEGALEREMLMQSMQTLRIHRPRMILHGPVGMGQGYVGAAALHHLEGYHVQSLELGTLLSDSTRTVEAAIVQLFVEAKRHQPSVIYIPSLIGWCAAVSETSRSTVRAMLDTLLPTDPILLLAIVDGAFSELPRDVKAWFGLSKDNRVELKAPTADQREAFFEGLIKDACRPPNQFADGIKRKKRVLEVLPIAPPLEPRKPTAAELALQEESDQKTITLLKYRLGPILTELKRKFKRFTKRATEEYDFEAHNAAMLQLPIPPPIVEVTQPLPEFPADSNGIVDITGESSTQPAMEGVVNGIIPDDPFAPQEQAQAQVQLPNPNAHVPPPLFDMDLEKMQADLFKGRYLTPQDFLDDVGKMVHNADVCAHEDLDRLYKAQAMFTATQVSIQEFDPQLRLECERMAVRERQRREEHRLTRAKEKAAEDASAANTAANGNQGARRSARANGLQPELGITDPVRLERRLKRQRGEDVATDSHGSEEENAEGRELKRSKTNTLVSDDNDRDPLDLVGVPSPTPVRPFGVRFASDLEPMRSLTASSTNGAEEGKMVVDAPTPRRTGFDAFLLNPLPSADGMHILGQASSSSNHNSRRGTPSIPAVGLSAGANATDDLLNPFITHSPNKRATPSPRPGSRARTRSPLPPKSVTSPRPIDTEEHEVDKRPSSPIPMVVERTPTPLPDFHIDEGLVAQLKQKLMDDTAQLTVEQLEQLRATCLGAVWRHRSEWDRDALVKELDEMVVEFIREIAVDEDGY